MDLGISGRRAIVTGASRGIGRAIALSLAGEGVSFAAVAYTEASARETADLAAAAGVEARAFGVDVASAAEVDAAVRTILADMGPVQILVNNAGITRDGLLLRMSDEDFDRVLAVNLKGAFHFTRALARSLLREKGARIVNVASVVGLTGNAGQANYAASKGGLIAMTRSLALEFAGRGVTVNAVAPGFVATDMTAGLVEKNRAEIESRIPLGRLGSPADIAGAVVWLASEQAAYVTGAILVVDGGLTL